MLLEIENGERVANETETFGSDDGNEPKRSVQKARTRDRLIRYDLKSWYFWRPGVIEQGVGFGKTLYPQ